MFVVRPPRECALAVIDPIQGRTGTLPLAGELCASGEARLADLTLVPAEGEARALLGIGTLSVTRSIGDSGAASFESASSSQLFRLPVEALRGAPALPEVVSVDPILRRQILEEVAALRRVYEEQGLSVEQEKRGLVVGGLAATPDGGFVLGLASPRLCPPASPRSPACRAIALYFDDLERLFQAEATPPKLTAHRLLDLGGSGVASLEYLADLGGYLVVAAAPDGGRALYLLRFQQELTRATLAPVPLPAALDARHLRSAAEGPGGAALLYAPGSDACPTEGGALVPLPLAEIEQGG